MRVNGKRKGQRCREQKGKSRGVENERCLWTGAFFDWSSAPSEGTPALLGLQKAPVPKHRGVLYCLEMDGKKGKGERKMVTSYRRRGEGFSSLCAMLFALCKKIYYREMPINRYIRP